MLTCRVHDMVPQEMVECLLTCPKSITVCVPSLSGSTQRPTKILALQILLFLADLSIAASCCSAVLAFPMEAYMLPTHFRCDIEVCACATTYSLYMCLFSPS